MLNELPKEFEKSCSVFEVYLDFQKEDLVDRLS